MKPMLWLAGVAILCLTIAPLILHKTGDLDIVSTKNLMLVGLVLLLVSVSAASPRRASKTRRYEHHPLPSNPHRGF